MSEQRAKDLLERAIDTIVDRNGLDEGLYIAQTILGMSKEELEAIGYGA